MYVFKMYPLFDKSDIWSGINFSIEKYYFGGKKCQKQKQNDADVSVVSYFTPQFMEVKWNFVPQ